MAHRYLLPLFSIIIFSSHNHDGCRAKTGLELRVRHDRPDGNLPRPGFANVLGTTQNDFFDNLTGGVTVTGGAGAVDHFALAANVLNSASIPTITNYSSSIGEAIDLSALLDAKFGPGSNPATASNFVAVKEDAGGNSATLEINVNGTPGGTFVAAAHLGGVHSGDIVTAILDHAHTTAQLHAA